MDMLRGCKVPYFALFCLVFRGVKKVLVLKVRLLRYSAFLKVVLAGIEPAASEPESEILSIKLQDLIFTSCKCMKKHGYFLPLFNQINIISIV